METPNFYATLPAAVRYDKNLKPSEKLLYAEIVGLTNVKGYCYASNAYFERLYDASTRTVQGWLKHLQDCGYIEIIQVGGGAGEQRAERRICPLVGMTIAPQTPAKICATPAEKCGGTPAKKCADPPQKNAGRLLQDNINTREINAGARARENGDVLSILLNGFPDGCGERLRQALKDFAAARAAGKHPLTARAAKLVCSTLQRLADEAGVRDRYGYMAAVLEQSILRGWEGLFPLKDDSVDKAPAQRPANTADRPREIGPDTDITDFL